VIDPEPNQPFSAWRQVWLSRFDQPTIVVILVASLLAIAFSFWHLRATHRGLIDIDDVPRESIRFVVDVNEAEWPELGTLPGIGPKLAQAIVDHRHQYGPFGSLDDLLDVPGIGSVKLAAIRPYLLPLSTSDSAAVVGTKN
jgi:competence ComEA-like helix-hairpin-helix protein